MLSLEKLRLMGAFKDRLLAGPRIIILDIYQECNIRCNYCWTHSLLNRGSKKPALSELKFAEIKKIIDQAFKWRCNNIFISGYGEPTLNPDFKKTIDYIRGGGIKTYIFTNATFTKKLLPTVSMSDNICINFSMPNKKLYNKYISPNNNYVYDRVLENLKIFSHLNKKYGKPLIHLSYVINATNYKLIPELLGLVANLAINRIAFRMIMPTKYTKVLMLSNQQKRELDKILISLRRKHFPFTQNLNEIRLGIKNNNTSPYNLPPQCFTGWFNLIVNNNKRVSLCCHNERTLIGNLKTHTLKEIWESEQAHRMRILCKYKFNLNNYPFNGSCEWCHWHNENYEIFNQLAGLIKLGESIQPGLIK